MGLNVNVAEKQDHVLPLIRAEPYIWQKNSLLHNHYKKIKKKEEDPNRKGGPSEYSGGFSFVQKQDKRILFISDLDFRIFYGIFFISN